MAKDVDWPAVGPRLLEALERAPIVGKYHGVRGFEFERFIEDYAVWRGIARAAIAAAKGETT